MYYNKYGGNNMEIELKYIVENETKANKIFLFLEKEGLVNKENIYKKDMNAIYYDTSDLSLKKNKIALRTRREGKEIYATLKWGGSESAGLHKREEINILVNNETIKDKINIELFKGLNIYSKLQNIIKNNKLVKLFETKVVREIAIMKVGETEIEFVYDNGNIFTENKNDRISEIEMELIQGSEKELLKFGNMISEKFNIQASSVSKFERGLRLIL